MHFAQVALAWIGPAYLLAVSLPLAIIDIRQRRLPNRLVLPGLAITWLAHVSAVLFGAEWARMLTAWLTATRPIS